MSECVCVVDIVSAIVVAVAVLLAKHLLVKRDDVEKRFGTVSTFVVVAVDSVVIFYERDTLYGWLCVRE